MSNTYCRECSLKVSGIFPSHRTSQYKQASGPSRFGCQAPKLPSQCCCPVEPPSTVFLLHFWMRWVLAGIWPTGCCLCIVSPSCLELLRRGILCRHLWNIERGRDMLFQSKSHTSIISTQHSHIQRCGETLLNKSCEQEATGKGSGRIYASLNKVCNQCPPFFVLDLTAKYIPVKCIIQPSLSFTSNIKRDSNLNRKTLFYQKAIIHTGWGRKIKTLVCLQKVKKLPSYFKNQTHPCWFSSVFLNMFIVLSEFTVILQLIKCKYTGRIDNKVWKCVGWRLITPILT